MNIRLGKPTASNAGRILTDYYKDEEKISGTTLFHNVVLKKLAINETDMPLIYALDRNYQAAFNRFLTLQNHRSNGFIGIYADNNKVLAHTLLKYETNEDGQLIAVIDGLYIHEIEDFLNTTNSKVLRWIYGLYSMLIEYIEKDILKDVPELYAIKLISTADDEDFWLLVKQFGYHLTQSEDDHGIKLHFTKKIREKELTYERRYPTKQD